MPPNRQQRKTEQSGDQVTPPRGELASHHGAEQRAQELRREADQLQIIGTRWRGQLPHPDDLRAYDELVPGSAERLINQLVGEREQLLTLQVSQTEHREQLELKVTTSNIEGSHRGQHYALVIVLAALLISGFAIYKDFPWQGLAGILGSLAMLAGVFIYGNERRVGELRSKLQLVLGAGESNPDETDST